jgi:hypothetical protein
MAPTCHSTLTTPPHLARVVHLLVAVLGGIISLSSIIILQEGGGGGRKHVAVGTAVEVDVGTMLQECVRMHVGRKPFDETCCCCCYTHQLSPSCLPPAACLSTLTTPPHLARVVLHLFV